MLTDTFDKPTISKIYNEMYSHIFGKEISIPEENIPNDANTAIEYLLRMYGYISSLRRRHVDIFLKHFCGNLSYDELNESCNITCSRTYCQKVFEYMQAVSNFRYMVYGYTKGKSLSSMMLKDGIRFKGVNNYERFKDKLTKYNTCTNEDDPILSKDLRYLVLDKRTYDILSRNAIFTIGDVINSTTSCIKGIRTVGDVTVNNIVEAIHGVGRDMIKDHKLMKL